MKMLATVSLASALLAAAADGQLVVSGFSQGGTSTHLWYVDVASSERTLLQFPFTGYAAIGVDDAAKQVYLGWGDPQVYRWSYGSAGAPQLLGFTHLPSGFQIGFSAFAFGGGRLFGVFNSIYGPPPPHGFYEIDTTTLVVSLVSTTGGPSRLPEGLGFNPADGFFYGAVEPGTAITGGIYRYDLLGSGAVTFVAPPPPATSDRFGGVAVGNGRVYLVDHDPGRIAAWDLAAQTYVLNGPFSPFVHPLMYAGADWAAALDVRRQPQIYCEPKVGSQNCMPFLTWTGNASASNSGPFELNVTRLGATASMGVLMYSVTGPASTPFAGGTLCIAAPLQRTYMPTLATGGGGCRESLTMDFNAFIGSGTNPALAVGQNAWLQFLWRDSGFAVPNNIGLSPGLRVLIAP